MLRATWDDIRRWGVENRVRPLPRPGEVQAATIAGAVVGATTRRRTAGPVAVTVGVPKPDTHLALDAALRSLLPQVARWYLRWHPVSVVLRVVVTSVRSVPMGTVQTGRWAYRVGGYVRTILSVHPWVAEVDGATGHILALDGGEEAHQGVAIPWRLLGALALLALAFCLL